MMRDGAIVADGTPRELMNEHADADVRALLDTPRRQAERVAAPAADAAARERAPRRAPALLPDYLGAHVLLSAAALVLGVAISLPLAVAACRSARMRWPRARRRQRRPDDPEPRAAGAVLSAAARALGAVAAAVRHGFSALGFLPSLLALTLYSMLPILRNARHRHPERRSGGHRGRARRRHDASAALLRVELPLAAPVIMAGIRTAAVWVIGAATLSTPVGQTSLGNYIFSGLQTQNWVSVLFGCVAAAALALVVDQLLRPHRVGRDRRERTPRRVSAALAACSPPASRRRRRRASTVRPERRCRRRKELHRAVHPRRPAHQIASRERRRRCDRARSGSARRSPSTRSRPATSTPTSTIPGTLWTNVMRRTDDPAKDEELMLREMAAAARTRARRRAARRARLRERLRARDACASGPSSSASRRLPILRRTLTRNSRSAADSSSSRGPNGRRCGTRMASISRRAVSSSRRSCIKRSRPGKWTSSRRSRATAESPRTTSSCSTIRAARSCRTT